MSSDHINLFFSLLGASVTIFLGSIVYLHDKKSTTNAIFFIHSLVGTLWAIATYFSIIAPIETSLFWIRLVIFFAAPHVCLFFLFVINFPNQRLVIKKPQLILFTIVVVLLMALAMSPYGFENVRYTAENAIVPVPGFLMPVFGITLVIVFFSTVYLVFKKYFKSTDAIRQQWFSIGAGLLTAYTLLIFLVFLRVILFDNTRFVPYSPLFILPIFIGAAYAILRHNLFNVKVIATEIITFLLIFGGLIQIILAESTLGLILALALFIFVLISTILLIRSVLNEVRQREELQHLTRQLQDANTKLEELSRFKTQLLSLASHQIKSPIAAIKGFVSILLEGLYGPVEGKVKETLGKVRHSADELIALINMLLDLRKVEEGKMEYTFARTDLCQLITGVVDELHPLAMEKKLDLSFGFSSPQVFAQIDPTKFKQIIQNFVDNAIKYTPSGFVKVFLKQEGGLAIISVSDSGLGLSPELIPHLFEEFVRDERVKNKILGTGFGLFIARKIIEAHGGKLWAESAGEGKGSAFFVQMRTVE